MKKTIYVLTALCFVVLATLASLHYWLNSPPPATVNQAEDALAREGVIILAHINNQRINQIIDTVGSDPQSLDLPVLQNNLFSALYYGESHFKKNLQQLVYSVNLADTPSFNLILQGQFDWLSIQNDIANYWQIQPLTENSYLLTEREIDDGVFVCPDEKEKQVKQQFYLHFSVDNLVISNDEKELASITQRLSTKQSAEIDLTAWRHYRDSHLASAALFVPEKADKATSGFTRMMVKSVVNDNKEIASLYAGISLNLMQRRININSQVNADLKWVIKAQQATEQYIATMQQEVAGTSPTLAALINNFSVAAQQNSLIVNLALKEQDIAKLGDVFGELLSSVFSITRPEQEEELAEQSIEESPWDYKLNDQLAHLTHFQTHEFFGKPTFVDGPLAISLESVSIDQKTGLLMLNFESGINMPNIDGYWSDSKLKYSLTINSVSDINGNEMLRDERCLKDLGYSDGNEKAATHMSVNNNIGSLTKSVRLKPDSDFNQVANIKGTLDFSMPTSVKTVELELKKGASYEQHGVRVFLNDVAQQRITYQLSGDKDKLLEVRALNKNGQVLKSSYSSAISGKKTTAFKGDIAKIQLLIATEQSRYKSDFSIDAVDFFDNAEIKELYLSVRPQAVSKPQWLDAVANTPSEQKVMAYVDDRYNGEYKVASWYQAPVALLMSHNITSQWTTNLNYHLAMPFISDLAYNLQAVEIKTQYNDEKVVNYHTVFPYVVINPDQTKGKYLPHDKIDGVGFVKNSSDINLDIKPQQQLGAVTGQLNINLPLKVATINVGKPSFNAEKFDHAIEVQLQKINAGFIPRYEYRVSAANLINMIAVLDDGKELLPVQSTFEQGAWILRYPLTQKIDHFEVLVATEVEQLSYPFELVPNYQQTKKSD